MLRTGGRAEGTRRIGSHLRPRLIAIAAAVVLTLAILVRLTTPGPRAPPVPTGVEVHLTCATREPERPCAFAPSEVVVLAGTAVHWVNNESVFHTITSTDSLDLRRPNGVFDQTIDERGETFEFTFPVRGTFHYYCQAHVEFMIGTVVVE